MDRQESLIALYEAVSAEIARLRDTEFRAALFSLGLDAGIIATYSNEAVAEIAGSFERWAGILLSTIVVMMLMAHLLGTHSYLSQHRKIRHRLESSLGAHDRDAFDGEPLFPAEWAKANPGFRFQLSSVVVPLLAVMALFHSATILIIWRVTA